MSIDVPPDVHVQGNRRQIEQVIGHLLENALAFTDPGGRIEVRLRPSADLVTVAVEDDGIGISTDDLGRIFRPFARASDTRTTGTESSGLGLFVCHEIISQRGGSIWAESVGIGKGVTNKFTLKPAGPPGDPRGND